MSIHLTIKNIAGVWKLKSFYITKNGKKTSWGKNMTGMLIYYPTGYMSVSINSKIGKVDKNNSMAILNSILFYSGKYTMKDNIILHEVENASDPDRIKKIMFREATINGNSLKLIGKGNFWTAELIWNRISQ